MDFAQEVIAIVVALTIFHYLERCLIWWHDFCFPSGGCPQTKLHAVAQYEDGSIICINCGKRFVKPTHKPE